MKKTPKRTTTKRSGSIFGGRSTAVGVGYEAKVAAFIAVKMLAGDGCDIWEGVNGEDVAAVTMQDAEVVDDVVVELRGESAEKVFISAKHRSRTIVAQEEAVRQRTWAVFRKLLSTAQAKLQQHQEHWRQLHADDQPDAEASKPIQEAINRTAHVVDDIASQLFFASGAFADEQNKDADRLTEAQKKRFWAEAGEILRALATEMHPHTAHHVVRTLGHLLPCAPREVFLVAARATTSSSSAGYQHESLAVSEVVKLIQCALADHREIFHNQDNSETECLAALLKVLDLFVEAGWGEARQLTHRLEEIYR